VSKHPKPYILSPKTRLSCMKPAPPTCPKTRLADVKPAPPT